MREKHEQKIYLENIFKNIAAKKLLKVREFQKKPKISDVMKVVDAGKFSKERM